MRERVGDLAKSVVGYGHLGDGEFIHYTLSMYMLLHYMYCSVYNYTLCIAMYYSVYIIVYINYVYKLCIYYVL